MSIKRTIFKTILCNLLKIWGSNRHYHFYIFCTCTDKMEDKATGDVAIDHYHRYEVCLLFVIFLC